MERTPHEELAGLSVDEKAEAFRFTVRCARGEASAEIETAGEQSLELVMVAGLEEVNAVGADEIHQPMFLCGTA